MWGIGRKGFGEGTSECGEQGEKVLGRGTIGRVKGVIVWLAWLVFAGSNKSVTKIKQHRKTSFVKITCQYSDVCLLGFIDSCLQTHMYLQLVSNNSILRCLRVSPRPLRSGRQRAPTSVENEGVI